MTNTFLVSGLGAASYLTQGYAVAAGSTARSLRFTGGRQLTTFGNVTTLDGAASWTLSFLFRYDGTPASASNWEFLCTQFQVPLFLRFAGGSGSTVNLYAGLRDSSSGLAETTWTITAGTVYHIALTYASGEQAYYLNGLKTAFGALTAPFGTAARPWLIGASSGAGTLSFSIDELAVWRNTVLSLTDITALRDGTATPPGLAATAYWPFSSPPKNAGDTVVIGDAGLVELGGAAALRWASVAGSGTAVYGDAMPFVPAASCVATVGTSGRTVTLAFAAKSDSSPVTPLAVLTPPSVAVNGSDLGPLAGLSYTLTGHHSRLLGTVPGAAAIGPADSVTVTAARAWANTAAGLTEAMAAQAAVNRAGQSAVRDGAAPRPMKVGTNLGHLITPEWSTYVVPKNLRYKTAYWQPGLVSADSTGKPVQLGGSPSKAPVHYDVASNLIDGTGFPAVAGLYAIGWDDLAPGTPTTLGLANAGGGDDTVVTERADLANLGSGGAGQVRVFNCQPGPSGAPIKVWWSITKADLLPQFANVVILGPGEFSYADGTPTVLPAVAATDTTASFRRRLPTDRRMGPLRWLDPTIYYPTGTSICEPEHLIGLDDWTWAQRVKKGWTVRFTEARPWSAAASPYLYSSLFGVPYTATLSVPISTAPAAGTQEVITISDAAAAPVLEGLKLNIDGETMRVLTVSGTAVTVERGSEGTTPAAHAAGPIEVRYRYAVASLAAFGPYNQQITELVTQSPHHLRTGQMPTFAGPGWPAFVYSDSRPFSGTWFTNYQFPVFVTGSNTFLTVADGPYDGSGSLPNTTLGSSYTLNPTNCYYQIYLPEYGGVPFEFAAAVTGQYPDTPLWVNIPQAATDSLVDEIARRVLAHFPAGRTVYLELADEPWNFGFPVARWAYTMDYLTYGAVGTQTRWFARRTAAIRARFDVIFGAAGRAGELKSVLNFQTTSAANVATVLGTLLGEGATVDAVAVAPYYSIDSAAGISQAFAAWDLDQLVDLWTFDVWYNTDSSNGQAPKLAAMRGAVDAWNAAHGAAIELLIYEYAPEVPWPRYGSTLAAACDDVTTSLTVAAGVAGTTTDPTRIAAGSNLRLGSEWIRVVSRSGTALTVTRGYAGTAAASHMSGSAVRNDWIEGVRDVVNHPNYYVADMDALALFQSYGVTQCVQSSLSQHYDGGTVWGIYHTLGQEPGRGDGSDGKLDNRLTVARPGQAHTKAATTSLDTATVSVRGQALIDWNAEAASAGGFLSPSYQGGFCDHWCVFSGGIRG